MNSKRKALLWFVVIASVGMMLFPPFRVVVSSTEINMGYGFLFAPPSRGSIVASISVSVLLAQWLVVVMGGAAGWFLVSDDKLIESNQNSHMELGKKNLVDSQGFNRLSSSFGVIGKQGEIQLIFRWGIFAVGFMLSLVIYALWKEYDKRHGGGF